MRKESKWIFAAGLSIFLLGLVLWLQLPHTRDTLVPGCFVVPMAAAGLMGASAGLLWSWRGISRPWRILAIIMLVIALLPLLLLAWMFLVAGFS